MSGVSFGGIQTLLAAEKGLDVRAFAAFAPGAMSWRWVTGLDARLEAAVQHAQAPVLIVQAQNDYNLAPSQVLGPLLEKEGKGRAVVFPAFGTTEQEGHGAFACRAEGTAVWGATVLGFLKGAVGEPQSSPGPHPRPGSLAGAAINLETQRERQANVASARRT